MPIMNRFRYGLLPTSIVLYVRLYVEIVLGLGKCRQLLFASCLWVGQKFFRMMGVDADPPRHRPDFPAGLGPAQGSAFLG